MAANRLTESLTTVCIGIALGLISAKESAAHSVALLALLATALALVGLALAADQLAHGVESGRWSRSSRARSLAASARAFRQLPPRSALRIFALSLLGHSLGIAVWLGLARSLGLTLSLPGLGWVRSAVQTANMLPISISGLGVREGALVVLLGPYAVSSADAVALSFLVFGLALLYGLLGGVLELSSRGRAGGVRSS